MCVAVCTCYEGEGATNGNKVARMCIGIYSVSWRAAIERGE